jgi:two-component system, sensor histidine kinase and response regulator
MIDPNMAMVSSYDYRLVVLSVLIAMFASYAALDLAGRITAASGRTRLAWLLGGATAMGVGIWSMHYIGMLAFQLPVPVLYDWPTVLLSLLAATFAAAVALFVVSRPKMGWLRALIGSAIMGGGIATMHYTGMAAMRLPAMCSYDPLLFTLSVVFAIVISLVALWLTFRFREDRKASAWWKAASAIVMGAAIPIMHYTGMAAARFTPSTVIPDTSHAVSTSTLGIAGVTAVSLLVLGVAVLTSVVGRRFSAQTLKLREHEKRILAITQTAPDAIVSADSDGRITYFNPAAERIFGYSSAEASGQPFTLLMPERFHSAHRAGLKRFLVTREARIIGKSIELVGRRKNGNEFPVSLSLSAWETGSETFFTGILRDITERKRADDKIQDLNKEMERRNAELIALNRELESFSYSVSHDLRAPLRAIDGFSLALLEDCGHKLELEEKKDLQRVRAAAARMGRLIDDMLNLARTARCELVRGKVDLSALAREILSELQKTEPERRLTLMIAPDLIVEGDRTLLRVVLENLLGNAWKFTSKRPDARVEFGGQDEGGRTVYFVRDNGAGFDMKYAGKLFGAFQRLHDGSEFPGSGIGLATVQRIVHRHGGRVWAEAAVGKGATFYFVVGGGGESRPSVDVARGHEVLSERSAR